MEDYEHEPATEPEDTGAPVEAERKRYSAPEHAKRLGVSLGAMGAACFHNRWSQDQLLSEDEFKAGVESMRSSGRKAKGEARGRKGKRK